MTTALPEDVAIRCCRKAARTFPDLGIGMAFIALQTIRFRPDDPERFIVNNLILRLRSSERADQKANRLHGMVYQPRPVGFVPIHDNYHDVKYDECAVVDGAASRPPKTSAGSHLVAREMLDALTPRERMVVLARVEGLSRTEIAARMGTHPTFVQRVVEAIRERWSGYKEKA